jgi:hypothetical protein
MGAASLGGRGGSDLGTVCRLWKITPNGRESGECRPTSLPPRRPAPFSPGGSAQADKRVPGERAQWIGSASVGPFSLIDGCGSPEPLVFRLPRVARLQAVVADAFDDEIGLTSTEGNAFALRLFAILTRRFY